MISFKRGKISVYLALPFIWDKKIFIVGGWVESDFNVSLRHPLNVFNKEPVLIPWSVVMSESCLWDWQAHYNNHKLQCQDTDMFKNGYETSTPVRSPKTSFVREDLGSFESSTFEDEIEP